MHSKYILYLGIIIGVLFSYCLKIVNNIWIILICTISALYLDIYCLSPVIQILLNKYKELNKVEVEDLQNIVVFLIPTSLFIFIKKINDKNKKE